MRLQPLRARKNQESCLLPVKPERPVLFFFLVPVYRELDSGNLARLLDNLKAQTIGQDRVRLVFLVNNTPEVAAETGSPAFQENQRTLEWLAARKKELSFGIEVVDLSTQGIERNMGKIRQEGVSRLLALPEAERLRAVVIHLDADTYVPPHFLARLGAFYETYGALETVFLLRDFEIRGVPSLDLIFTHHQYRLKKTLFDFHNVRSGLPYGVATYQITSRLSALERIGGVPPIPQHEDDALSKALRERTVWTQTAELEARTEDRTRSAGFNSQRREQDLLAQKKKARKGIFRLFRRLSWAEEIEARRPEAVKETFLWHALFHSLAKVLWAEVQAGRMLFRPAVDEYQRRMEKLLGRPVRRQRSRLFRYSHKELGSLPADSMPVPFSGGSVLNALAHPFSRLLVAGTDRPGTDLWSIFFPHLDAQEKQLAEKARTNEANAHNARVTTRVQALEAYLRGEEPKDFFVQGLVEAGPWLAAARERKQDAAALLAELRKVFPDWLEEYSKAGAAREASHVKILTALIALSRAGAKESGYEAIAETLVRLK